MIIKRNGIKKLLLFLIGVFCQTSSMMSRGMMIIYLGFCTLLFLLSINTKSLKIGKGLIWYSLFVLYCMFSLTYTINTVDPDFVYIRILTYLYLVFLVAPFFDEKENIKLVIIGFFIGGLIGILNVLISQYNLIGEKRLGDGIYGSYAEFGNVCMLTLSCFIWLKDKLFKNKIFKIIVFLFCCVAIILSGARKAILVPILMYLFLKILDRRSKISNKIMVLTIATSFVLVFLYVSLNNQALYDAIGYRIESGISSVLGNDEQDASLEERGSFKKLALSMFKEKPITGWGMHSFAYKSYQRGGPNVFSHDNFLELLCCYGIIGFLIYYISFVIIIANCRLFLRDDLGLFLFSYILIILIMDPYSISFLTSPYIILISASLQYCDIGKLKIKEGINNEAIYQIC